MIHDEEQIIFSVPESQSIQLFEYPFVSHSIPIFNTKIAFIFL